jgi:hypothetical protein
MADVVKAVDLTVEEIRVEDFNMAGDIQLSEESWRAVRGLLEQIRPKSVLASQTPRASVELVNDTTSSSSQQQRSSKKRSADDDDVVSSSRPQFRKQRKISAFNVSECDLLPTPQSLSPPDLSKVVDEPEVLPKVQKALVVASKGKYEIREDFPMPHVGEDEVMIRSHYVGLNPIDWKTVDYNFCLPAFPWVRFS